ncbi:MAG TPA: DNA/RNA nuclease SfsA [Symbiobacteriaceae bacterium]|nr:DNA/RNA nuclease SfsA [Symbiobacteriaceae bacterium]
MRGTFVERQNRFVALVRLPDGTTAPVHIASSGRMVELLVPGAPAEFTYDPQPGRQTAGTLTMVAHGDTWVSVDTGLPGKILRRQICQLPPFAGYTHVRPEFTYGESRIDFLLTADGLPPCLVEVKSVTSVLTDPDGSRVARFPDAPTGRGSRHLRELVRARDDGYRTAVLFVIQRADAEAFGPWDDIDPAFGAELRRSAAAGVEVHAWRFHVTPEKTALSGAVPLRF